MERYRWTDDRKVHMGRSYKGTGGLTWKGTGGLMIERYIWEGHIKVPPRWPSGKASASRAEDPGFESRLRQDFVEVESYQ